MQPGADVVQRGDGVDEVRSHVVGMAGEEADALQPVQGGHQAQQAGEIELAALPAVGGDVLAQQGHLVTAGVQDALDLRQDQIGVLLDLGPAGVGHDAVGAAVVAALVDGDEVGVVGGIQIGRRHVVHALVVPHGQGRAVAHDLVHQARQLVVMVHAHHQVDAVAPLQERWAQALGHAADDAHDGRLEAGLLALVPHLAHAADDLVLGQFAHRAGVQQHQVGPSVVVHGPKAHATQPIQDHLGVVRVHLAAVGLHVHGAVAVAGLGQGRQVGDGFLAHGLAFRSTRSTRAVSWPASRRRMLTSTRVPAGRSVSTVRVA